MEDKKNSLTWQEIKQMPVKLDDEIYKRAVVNVASMELNLQNEDQSVDDYMKQINNIDVSEYANMDIVTAILRTKEFTKYHLLASREEIPIHTVVDLDESPRINRSQEILQARSDLIGRLLADGIVSDTNFNKEILIADFYETLLEEKQGIAVNK